MMRYLSLFSGIEAASAAWHPLGWECVGVAEIEPFPCKLLAQRYPGVPNLGDITKITEADIMMLGQIDLIVFGSPCQDLSVAGKRKGLNGQRSGLFHDAMRIIGWAREWCDCRFALWENVPGAFTSNKGADFAVVVGALAGLDPDECIVPPKGWGNEGAALGREGMVEWSTLDAQWFGVAQRRRRVFALADFGDWTSRGPILLEPESLRGDSAPRRGSREDVAGTLAARPTGGGYPGTDEACEGHVIAVRPGPERVLLSSTGDVSHCLNAGGMSRIDYETETMVVCAKSYAIQAGALRENPNSGPDGVGVQADLAYTVEARSEVQAVAYDFLGTPASEIAKETDVHVPLRARTPGQFENSTVTVVRNAMRVRRLTPRECERLQAFPDDYTALPGAKDGPRYKALGNSMCVNVMHWIGRRIDVVHEFF